MNTRLSMLRVMWLLFAAACGDDGDTSSASPSDVKGGSTKAGSDAPVAGSKSAADAKAPVATAQDTISWSTEEFSLEAGQERYLCYAKALDEDIVVDGYSSEGQAFVHHLIFARTRAPEPEGFAECDIAFRDTWDTLYITGAGDAKLAFPSDAGHKVNKGTQLLVQMHLLNTANDAVKGAVTIRMHRSASENPRPVNTYVFGTAAVKLPPNQTTEITGTCKMREAAQLIAGFPHMHLLGQRLRFEVGSSEGTMTEIFKRDPYDFDSQRIENLAVSLNVGDITRVTCMYDNPMAQEITYGESTRNEMCYFVGFAVDRATQSGCLEVVPPNAVRR